MAAIRAERDERPTQFRRRLALRLDAFPRDLAVARRMSRVAAPFALGGVRRVAVVVLAFPCNQFANQEPGTNSEIYNFVTEKYQVDFPVFEKIDVNGANRAQLYEWLTTSKQTEDGAQDISWNFTKFLVDKDGNVVKHYDKKTPPNDFKPDIEALLAA